MGRNSMLNAALRAKYVLTVSFVPIWVIFQNPVTFVDLKLSEAAF